MTTSPESPLPYHYRSKEAFLASLPPWRRLLANLNWHPTVDKKVERYAIQQRTKLTKIAIEQIKNETERLRSENEQLRNERAQLRKEDERLAEIDARIDALWSSLNSSSTPAPIANEISGI